MNVKAIIDKFGGQTTLASLIGKGQSTVAYWVKVGSIPTRWQSKLLRIAQEKNIDLSIQDFIEQEKNISEQKDGNAAPTFSTLESTQSVDFDTTYNKESPFLFYTSDDSAVRVQVLVGDETVWASQQGMGDIFDTTKQNISYHLSNIYNDLELIKSSTVKEILTVQTEGDRSVERKIEFYSLDAIISVGYRINSYKATQFRKWATSVLKEYLTKGYALNDDRLKQGNHLFGKDYFDDLLEKIREIRASERRFYQKITDIYAQCSIDYDKNSPVTQQFYARVQDKLHYAIHGHTSAELLEQRADATKPHMGLQSWKNESKGGKINKSDVTIGKNYLSKEELENLNRLVSMYLDWAENFAKRQKPLTMTDWAEKLNAFLEFNAYDVLQDFGKARRKSAERHALREFEKFRVAQDLEYKSDFDEIVDRIKTKNKLPDQD